MHGSMYHTEWWGSLANSSNPHCMYDKPVESQTWDLAMWVGVYQLCWDRESWLGSLSLQPPGRQERQASKSALGDGVSLILILTDKENSK